jgi:pimeloyl-ACP methyl ester carboxylesterase
MNREVLHWYNRGRFHSYKEHKLFYVDEGVGDVVFIIHGYPYSSFEWVLIIDSLNKRYRTVAIDLLGMGFSDKPRNHKYSYEEYVEMMIDLLTSLNIKSINILAHDLGVSIVQEFLAQYVEASSQIHIQSIAYVNGGLFMDAYKPRFIQRLLSQTPDFFGKNLSKLLTKSLIGNSIKTLFSPTNQPSRKFLNNQWEILNFKCGKQLAYLLGRLVFEKYRYQARWIKAMQTTEIPMCFINGPYDPNSGEHMAKRYEEIIPNPLVYRLNPMTGHWPHVESPAEFLSTYMTFIKST